MNNIYDNKEFFDGYAQMERSKKGLEGAGEWHQLQPLFPDLKGKKILDIGCGYGWHCKYAIDKGAEAVLGLDLSEKMIEVAKTQNSHEGIEYRVSGALEHEYTKEEYDCVVSNLVLHYIEDLDQVYRKVHYTLKEGGTFLFNIEHPVFTGSVNQDWMYDEKGNALYWPVDNYFYPGERETHFLGQKVTKQHHTLTQIINGLLQNGFEIEVIEEAMPSEAMMDLPWMKDEMRRPMMLLIRARKRVL